MSLLDRRSTTTTRVTSTLKKDGVTSTIKSSSTKTSFNGVKFVLALALIVLLAVQFIRSIVMPTSEPLTFSALLEILANSPVVDFTSTIRVQPVSTDIAWLGWLEAIINALVSVINLVIWVVSQLVNFLSFVGYMLYNLLGFSLGF